MGLVGGIFKKPENTGTQGEPSPVQEVATEGVSTTQEPVVAQPEESLEDRMARIFKDYEQYRGLQASVRTTSIVHEVWYKMEKTMVLTRLQLKPFSVPEELSLPPESDETWDGTIKFQVPSDPADMVSVWGQYTRGPKNIVDLVAGYAGISREEAALWIEAGYNYWTQAAPAGASIDEGTYVTALFQAMAARRLEVHSGNMMEHLGEVVDFGYTEPE